ncbi:hypothetical protein EZV62_015824 [Acer yangbiense]|uniref:Uncharacterized protein n=1 Tax=Acer yangbiense TaxID=1000413 RepID=A0A5C7HMQ3_9ROSI|nr:hypothetical protein EZV62_015824 [Acer yangbiense]
MDQNGDRETVLHRRCVVEGKISVTSLPNLNNVGQFEMTWRKEDLLSLNESIGIIRGKESGRGIMLESKTVEGSTMIMKEAKRGGSNKNNNNSYGTEKMIGLVKEQNGLYHLDEFSGQNKDKQRDLFLLDLSTQTPIIPDLVTTYPQTANLDLSIVPSELVESSCPIVTTPQLARNILPPSEPTQSQGATRSSQVYTRREAPFLQLVKHQESDTNLGTDKGAKKIEVNSNPKTDKGGVSGSTCSTKIIFLLMLGWV